MLYFPHKNLARLGTAPKLLYHENRVLASTFCKIFRSVTFLQHAPKIGRDFPCITLYTDFRGVQVVFVQHDENAENGTLGVARFCRPCIISFMDNTQLLSIAESTIVSVWTKLRILYPAIERDTVGVKLNNRLKTTAGRCFLEHGYIDLCPSLMRENLDEFITVTIPHELAHQVAWDLFQCENHAKPWKSVMIALDLEPTPWHYMTTAAQRTKRC